MHELSIAMSIVEGVCEEAEKYPGERVDVVRLRLGLLSGVVREALLFSYDIACADTPLAGSRLEIEVVPAAIFCSACDAEKTIPTVQDIRCPECGMPSTNLTAGRELQIASLELSDEYTAAAS